MRRFLGRRFWAYLVLLGRLQRPFSYLSYLLLMLLSALEVLLDLRCYNPLAHQIEGILQATLLLIVHIATYRFFSALLFFYVMYSSCY